HGAGTQLGEELHHLVGLRRAKAGGQVVAGAGNVAVGAAGDVVEIGAAGGHLVEGRQRLRVTVERRRTALVGEGDEPGPLRRPGAGTAGGPPTGLPGAGVGEVQRVAGVRVGVEGDVRR